MRCHSGRTGKSKQAKTVCQQTERHTGNADCPMQGTMGTGAEDQLGPGSGWHSRCCAGTRRDQTSAKSWLPVTTMVPREQQECGCHPWLGARRHWSQASCVEDDSASRHFLPLPTSGSSDGQALLSGKRGQGQAPSTAVPPEPCGGWADRVSYGTICPRWEEASRSVTGHPGSGTHEGLAGTERITAKSPTGRFCPFDCICIEKREHLTLKTFSNWLTQLQLLRTLTC